MDRAEARAWRARLVNFLAALNPGLLVAAFDVNAYLAKGGASWPCSWASGW